MYWVMYTAFPLKDMQFSVATALVNSHVFHTFSLCNNNFCSPLRTLFLSKCLWTFSDLEGQHQGHAYFEWLYIIKQCR